jgi:hypothetical protein
LRKLRHPGLPSYGPGNRRSSGLGSAGGSLENVNVRVGSLEADSNAARSGNREIKLILTAGPHRADSFAQGRMLLRAGSACLLGDGGDGEALLRQAQALLGTFGPTKSLARCLSALASARLLAGDPSEAQALHTRAVGISRQIGA